MTVSTTLSRIEYQDDGASTVFPVPFRFLANADLVVERVFPGGAITTLVLGGDYLVNGRRRTAARFIIRSAVTSGATLRIRRSTPRLQPTDYTTGDAFPAESHERALDRVTMIAQETAGAQAATALRALLVPEGEAATWVPPAPDRAGHFLAFDASGQPVAASGTGGGDAALRQDIAVAAGLRLIGFQQSGDGAMLRTADDKLREIAMRPEDYGAKGDGATDDTAAFAALEAALSLSVSRRVALRARATYRTARFWVPDGTWIEGNGATIERTAPTADPLVSTGVKCVVEDLNVDGRLGAGVASSSIREIGIAVDDDCTVRRCTATRVYRHGISNKLVSEKLRYHRILIEDCYAHDCGASPSPDGSGTGDGIGLANVSDSVVRRCRGDGNARSGVTVTTYDPGTGTTDISLSTNITFEDVTAFDNAYATAINAELVTAPKFIRCSTDGAISFNNSPRSYLDRCEAASVSGVGAAHNPIILNVGIFNDKRGHELIALAGNSPTVIGGAVSTTFVPSIGNVVQILPPDGKGTVRDVIVIGGNNGFRLNVSDFSGLRCDTAAGLGIIEGPTGSSRNFVPSQMPEKIKGKINGVAIAPPTTGAWNRGDLLENLSPSAGGYRGWVCTASGTPGTWKGHRGD